MVRAGRWVSAGLLLACLPALAAAAGNLPVGDRLTTAEKRELRAEGRLVIELLQNLQYSDRQFHELDGSEIVTGFLKSLDPDRLVLTRSDADFLHRRFDRTIKTVYLLKGDLEPAFEIFDFVADRTRNRLTWVDTWLDGKIDLSVPGTCSISKEPPADAAEADQRWEARLKDAIIREILAGRDQPAAVAQVKKNFRKWGRELAALDALSVREHFFDGLINLFDPHSGYFSSEHAQEFQVMMQGAVVGVGLNVRLDEGQCFIRDVTAGGPADLAGGFQAGDEILALSEDGKTWRDVKGLPMQKIAAGLRGAAQSKLTIAVRTGQGPRREVTLTRTEVVIARDRARGGIVAVPTASAGPCRVGCILLPDFYAADSAAGKTSAAHDVRELIEQMKAKGLDALVLDLRENPGGAMTEAVALAGLFVPSGTVTIMRGMDGQTRDYKIDPAPLAYDGPLVVLTTSASASASEMFAGAMSYHHRAVIVGDAATFGKGTAQDYIDLNKFPNRPANAAIDWGTLRVTRSKFYFPDGKSPQRAGAASDIVLPFPGEEKVEREETLPHALPGDTISVTETKPAAGYPRVEGVLLADLKAKSERRAKELPEFSIEQKRGQLEAEASEEKPRSLQLGERRKSWAEFDARVAALRQDIRAIVEKEAYPGASYRIAAVQAARDEHAKCVRARRPAAADAKAGWLQGGAYHFEDGDGQLREYEIADVDFRSYLGDSADLATAYGSATGTAATPEAMTSAVRALSLLEERTDDAVLACFAGVGGGANHPEPAQQRRGVEAVLRRIVDLDPGLVNAWKRFDVAQREGLRIAADWAAQKSLAPGANAAGPSAPLPIKP